MPQLIRAVEKAPQKKNRPDIVSGRLSVWGLVGSGQGAMSPRSEFASDEDLEHGVIAGIRQAGADSRLEKDAIRPVQLEDGA